MIALALSKADDEFARLLPADASASARLFFDQFARAGLPGRRVESWHYSDLRARLRAVPPLACPPGRGVHQDGERPLLRSVNPSIASSVGGNLGVKLRHSLCRATAHARTARSPVLLDALRHPGLLESP